MCVNLIFSRWPVLFDKTNPRVYNAASSRTIEPVENLAKVEVRKLKEPIFFCNGIPMVVDEDYKRIFQIPLSNPKMDDERRTIHEEDNEEKRCSTQAFLVKTGNLPLGNHYHRTKTEVFFIISGRLDKLITSDDEGNHRKEFVDVPPGTMIVMPPRVAHTFFLAEGSRMICYATERFDPNDMPGMKLA